MTRRPSAATARAHNNTAHCCLERNTGRCQPILHRAPLRPPQRGRAPKFDSIRWRSASATDLKLELGWLRCRVQRRDSHNFRPQRHNHFRATTTTDLSCEVRTRYASAWVFSFSFPRFFLAMFPMHAPISRSRLYSRVRCRPILRKQESRRPCQASWEICSAARHPTS